MGRGGSIELWLAGITILGITLVYLVGVAFFQTIPASGWLFGHLTGIFGFLLMLCTEILYTLRKKSRNARWGRMSTWLQAHIFTCLVGPFMILLHSSWKFNGLAGVVMLLTVIIVASGFIGRYIYTAVPRNLDGAMVDAPELERQVLAAQAELERMITGQPGLARLFGLAQP